jgi:hypothetical protein
MAFFRVKQSTGNLVAASDKTIVTEKASADYKAKKKTNLIKVVLDEGWVIWYHKTEGVEMDIL